MATDLRCPECRDNLGKDKENTVDAHCGTCGHNFYNQYGYIEDQAHLEKCKKLFPGKKMPKPDTNESVYKYVPNFQQWMNEQESSE